MTKRIECTRSLPACVGEAMRQEASVLARLFPVLAGCVVVFSGQPLGYGAQVHTQRGYLVTGPDPVIVRLAPTFGAAVVGTLRPGSFLQARSLWDTFEGEPTIVDEHVDEFLHAGGSDWEGWVLTADVTPAQMAPDRSLDFERSPQEAELEICREDRSLCSGP